MASTPPSNVPLPPDDNRGTPVLILGWVSVSVAGIIVILRLVTRGVLRNTLGWDDYMIVVAQVRHFLYFGID